MKRLTKEQIKEIKELYSNGKNSYELAIQFNVSQPTIMYWVNDKVRNKVDSRTRKWFKDLNLEQRRKIYKKRKEYFRVYMYNRYNNKKLNKVKGGKDEITNKQ